MLVIASDTLREIAIRQGYVIHTDNTKLIVTDNKGKQFISTILSKEELIESIKSTEFGTYRLRFYRTYGDKIALNRALNAAMTEAMTYNEVETTYSECIDH